MFDLDSSNKESNKFGDFARLEQCIKATIETDYSMDNKPKTHPAVNKQHALLIFIGKVFVRILVAVLALAFGFWLVMASNMGLAYLTNVCNGCLDFWIRMTLLGLGFIVWIITAAWLFWPILRYIYRCIRRNY